MGMYFREQNTTKQTTNLISVNVNLRVDRMFDVHQIHAKHWQNDLDSMPPPTIQYSISHPLWFKSFKMTNELFRLDVNGMKQFQCLHVLPSVIGCHSAQHINRAVCRCRPFRYFLLSFVQKLSSVELRQRNTKSKIRFQRCRYSMTLSLSFIYSQYLRPSISWVCRMIWWN